MTSPRENAHEGHDPAVSFESGGVDELGVIAWPILLRRRLARKVGIDRRWAVLWVVLGGLFTTGFTITLLVVSLARIATELHTSTTVLTWAITGPMLAFGVVGPAFGKAGDLWGHKRIFVGGLLFATVFAFASALAWNAATLILFRTLSATAGSACSPSAMAYINRMFEPADRMKPLGYWSFVTAGSPVIGVVIGGPLVEAVGWRAIFMVQAPMCLVGLVLAWWLLPNTERLKGVRFDVWGSVTLGLGASLLLAAISQGRSWGWASAATIGCLLLSVLSLVAFVLVEQRAVAPLVVLKWFGTRNFAWPVTSQMFANFAYMGGFFLIPQVLGVRGLGLGEATTGYLVIARPLAFSLTAPLAAFVTIRVGERTAGVVGGIGVMVSMIMWSTVGHGTGYVYIVAATAMSGVGLGIASPALTSLMVNAVADHDIGVAGAMQQLTTQLGAVLGAAVLATVSVTASTTDLRSFHTAFLVGAAAAVVAAVAAGFVHSTPRESVQQ
ncbi:MAG: MFS transporter [Actinomycetota bacterium]